VYCFGIVDNKLDLKPEILFYYNTALYSSSSFFVIIHESRLCLFQTSYLTVVGVLEELPATLEVLEDQIPEFFAGVNDLYFNVLKGENHGTEQHCLKTCFRIGMV
jgi:hypothetical protein